MSSGTHDSCFFSESFGINTNSAHDTNARSYHNIRIDIFAVKLLNRTDSYLLERGDEGSFGKNKPSCLTELRVVVQYCGVLMVQYLNKY